ncbi:flagellar basal body rod protein FlgC [Tissierella creatinophila]|uniref:Flagellar basal-body rod protein FlgC n=1 Tax=Tissierella creatinophila DSM 6911 TaxID=1123403 RepID=A0A1U7M8Z8_TISCR|nr:flagellar basal body rod protein FlgC [Tissierella creatinophila]OLS03777.1 flagellar basal-body rod protein FlgC [Tissierella creatinophila DSM 6911]
MSIFNSMKINSSGLSLERLKMDVISTNMANVNTTRTEGGGPYLKKQVLFTESLVAAKDTIGKKKSEGVKVVGIRDNDEGLREVYDPDHPDSNEEGYVLFPNVNMVDEMISLINVQRTYEANVTALTTSKNILKKALEISKG